MGAAGNEQAHNGLCVLTQVKIHSRILEMGQFKISFKIHWVIIHQDFTVFLARLSIHVHGNLRHVVSFMNCVVDD